MTLGWIHEVMRLSAHDVTSLGDRGFTCVGIAPEP